MRQNDIITAIKIVNFAFFNSWHFN